MILFETIFRRWYAFGFLVAFFWAASAERGWKKAARFLALSAAISFLAEYMSTHYGYPYGWYRYIGSTRGDELYLSNVPLFVPLTFGLVVWAGRSLARAGLGARSAWQVIVGGAALATVIDFAIDPMTLRGHTWFFGKVYEYLAHRPLIEGIVPPPYQGGWFDVPWSNFLGWFVVGALILWVDELFEPRGERPLDPLRGPTLAAFICLFFIVIAFATRHWVIAFASCAITAGLYVATAANIRERFAQAELTEGDATDES